jgi:hypothetical protein
VRETELTPDIPGQGGQGWGRGPQESKKRTLGNR